MPTEKVVKKKKTRTGGASPLPNPRARSVGPKVKPVPDLQLELHRQWSRHQGQHIKEIQVQMPGAVQGRLQGLGGHAYAERRERNPFYYAIGQGAGVGGPGSYGQPLHKIMTSWPLFEMWAPEYWDNYAAMDPRWAEYRRNWLVRACINAIAFWSTKNDFQTRLEAANEDQFGNDENAEKAFLDKYAGLKSYIDQANKTVDLKHLTQQMIIESMVIGHMGYEMETNNAGQVTRLVHLRPQMILPVISPDWELAGYAYRWQGFSVQNPYFLPEELFYVAYNDVDGSYKGLSAIEPILKEIQLDDKVVREDLTEAATTMWAGLANWMLDFDKLKPGTTESDIDQIIANFVALLRPGAKIVTDSRWTYVSSDVQPKIDQLLAISTTMQSRIIGNFQVPRMLVGLEQEGGHSALNRATAYAELEAFADGPISYTQTWLAGCIEIQWYNRLTVKWLLENDPSYHEGDPQPIYVRHVFNEIRTTDWFDLLAAVTAAYAQGTGFINQQKAYEMMNKGVETPFDPAELEAIQEQPTNPEQIANQKPAVTPTAAPVGEDPNAKAQVVRS